MGFQTLKKYRYLRATNRALIVFAQRINYKYIKVPGHGGAHASDGHSVFEIHVGQDQSLEDKVITLSHELGHALDYVHSPIGLLEKHNRLIRNVDMQAISREVAAWGYGQQILRDMGCFKYVRERFLELKEHGLETYISAVEEKEKNRTQ